MSIAKLEAKIRQLRNANKLLPIANKQMAIAAKSLAKQGFETSTAPNGQRWKPLKYRKGKPLVLTGQLSKFGYRVTKGGFILLAGAEYFVHHQHGAPANNLPARPMVPNGSTWGKWAGPMVRAAEVALKRWLK